MTICAQQINASSKCPGLPLNTTEHQSVRITLIEFLAKELQNKSSLVKILLRVLNKH